MLPDWPGLVWCMATQACEHATLERCCAGGSLHRCATAGNPGGPGNSPARGLLAGTRCNLPAADSGIQDLDVLNIMRLRNEIGGLHRDNTVLESQLDTVMEQVGAAHCCCSLAGDEPDLVATGLGDGAGGRYMLCALPLLDAGLCVYWRDPVIAHGGASLLKASCCFLYWPAGMVTSLEHSCVLPGPCRTSTCLHAFVAD